MSGFRNLFAGVAALLLGACALPQALPGSDSLTPPPGHVVIVGKVVLDPPFAPDLEQRTHWNIIGDERMHNRVMLSTDVSSRPISTGAIDVADWQEYIDAEWGEVFVAVMPRETRFLNGMATPLDMQSQDFLWFPGGMVLRPPADADVIYVGTLRYVRNDFNETVNIEVLDEKTEALAAVRQRYGRVPADLPSVFWLRQMPWEGS